MEITWTLVSVFRPQVYISRSLIELQDGVFINEHGYVFDYCAFIIYLGNRTH